MNRTLAWLMTTLTLAGLRLAPNPASAQEGTENPCQLADEYLASGLIGFAEAAYQEVLEDSPTEECAINGLVALGSQKCDLAKEQAEAGDLEAAKTTYLEIITVQPGLDCAVNGLAGLSDPVPSVKGLVSLGDYSQAWTKLIEGLQKDPNNEELIAISKQPWALTYKVTSFWDAYVGSVLTIFGALLVVILATRLVFQRRRLRLDVQDFTSGLAVSADLDEAKIQNLLERMSNRFEEAFNKLGQTRRVRRPDLIDQPMSSLAIPDIASTLSLNTGKIVVDILNAISSMYPPKLVTVSGYLDDDAEKGLGIGMKLIYKRNNEIWGMDYIWEKDVIPDTYKFPEDKADPVDHEITIKTLILVKYAAVLCIWRFIEGKYRDKAKEHLLSSFGTVDYRSHIATYLATELQTKYPDDLLQVEKLLRRALTLDPDNVAALNNMGFLMYQKGNLERKEGRARESKVLYAEGEKYLKRVFEISEQSDQFTTAFITAKYVLGIMYLDDDNLTDAARQLEEAARTAEASGDTASDLLDMIRIPLASTLRPSNPEKAKAMIDTVAGKAQTNPRVVYNLACYFAAASEDDPENYFDKSLRYLERTFIADQSYVKYSTSDPSLAKLRSARKDEYQNLMNKYPDKPPRVDPKAETHAS